MKLRYISDIHLEFYKPAIVDRLVQEIKPESDDEVLILAGDIGHPRSESYDKLMKHAEAAFKKTFVIAGNHEFYRCEKDGIPGMLLFMREYFKQFKHVTFLDNSCEIYEGYTFIGSTLWSRVTNPQYTINDIHIKGLNIDVYNRYNQECVEYLKGALAKLNNKVIVITHHMPSESLINPKYLEGEVRNYNQWFYCDMDEFILEHKYTIACWIYGHTHTPSISSVYGVPMLCNPMGYPGENSEVDFQKVFHLGEKN